MRDTETNEPNTGSGRTSKIGQIQELRLSNSSWEKNNVRNIVTDF